VSSGFGVPAFRDGGHFYRPLFWYICDEAALGRFPLWNPYENLGQPFAADPTSLCFYPVMLIAVLAATIGVNRDLAYLFLVAFHIFLALITCYRFIRINQMSRNAATFAALSYSLSGAVLFQFNNLPFLIGAAWLPEALRQIIVITYRRKFEFRSGKTTLAQRYCDSNDGKVDINHCKIDTAQTDAAQITLSQKKSCEQFVCSPINIIALAFTLSMMVLGGDPQTAYNAVICALIIFLFSLRYKLGTIICFLLSGLFAFMFSAIQILPSIELWQKSDRVIVDHDFFVNNFSLPFGRVFEIFFAVMGGGLFPVNTYLPALFWNEKSIWTSSIYIGLLPAIFAICAIIFMCISITSAIKNGQLKAMKRHRFKFSIFILFILFLFAGFGSRFLIYDLFRLLPAYNSFRYPAKLFTVASLMFIFFAAVGFDWLRSCTRFSRLVRFGLRLAVIIQIAFGTVILSVGLHGANHPLFGLFDSASATINLIRSIIIVTIILILFELFYYILIGRRQIDFAKKFIWRNNRSRRFFFGWLLIVLLAVDLFVAQNRLLISIPLGSNSLESSVADLIKSDNHLQTAKNKTNVSAFNNNSSSSNSNSNMPIRIYRFNIPYPSHFKNELSLNRVSEIMDFEQLTLLPRYPLFYRFGVVNVRGAMMPADYYSAILQLETESRFADESLSSELFAFHLEQLGVRYIIAESNSFACSPNFDADKIDIESKNIRDELGGVGDVCSVAVSDLVSIWRLRNPVCCDYILYEPNRIIFNVEVTEGNSQVVLPEQYWSGWRAYDGKKEIQIKQVRKIFRAVNLTKGKHQITMIYDPPLIKLGCIISSIGIILAIIFVRLCRESRPKNTL
jgi:hypothetical protein